jgi:hypothetical protein
MQLDDQSLNRDKLKRAVDYSGHPATSIICHNYKWVIQGGISTPPSNHIKDSGA